MLKSDTPRTDELLCKLYGTERCEAEKIVNAFARQLERELELTRAELLGTQKINAELREKYGEQEYALRQTGALLNKASDAASRFRAALEDIATSRPFAQEAAIKAKAALKEPR